MHKQHQSPRTHLKLCAVLLPVLVWLIAGSPLHAAPRMSGLFVDNMVLQRDKPVPVWGWAEAGERVTVEFAGQKKSCQAGEDGKWIVRLDAMSASAAGRKLTIESSTGNHQSSIGNVLVGDVWICSGQSNMEWVVANSSNAAAEIADSTNPQIRHFKVPLQQSVAPQDDVQGGWQESGPQTTGNFTAVGYFFARRLNRELGVPIGLIGTNWGGTRIEPWTPPLGFEMVPELAGIQAQLAAKDPATPEGKANYQKALDKMRVWLEESESSVAAGRHPSMPPAVISTNHQEPTRLFNAMVNPIIPYAIRGVIWYQGESNSGERDSYFHKKKALIQSWRQLWDQGPFPFYFVQLTSFQYPNKEPAGGDGWAWFREAQNRTLSLENTGMAVIIDIGDAADIHPRNKQDVGARLAQWALAKEYGRDIVPSGPLYRSQQVESDSIRISFDHVGSGLMVGRKVGLAPTQEVSDGKLAQFAIAGEDRKWHWADASIDGATVVVSSPDVPKPVAVRYAFRTNPEGANLYNREGLPASPFRTDDW